MVPFQKAGLTDEEQQFNKLHTSSRIIIENAFGLLKGWFRVLLKQVELETSNVDQVILTCCSLHNYCIKEKEEYPEDWLVDSEGCNIALTNEEIQVYNNEWGHDGKDTCELLC
jgi:hypothetical protein